MNITDDSSVETLDSDLGISAAFMSIAESAGDRRRAQSAFKAAVKHYNEAAHALAWITDAVALDANDADYLRGRLHALELRVQRFEQRESPS